jgi:hypothetical protein
MISLKTSWDGYALVWSLGPWLWFFWCRDDYTYPSITFLLANMFVWIDFVTTARLSVADPGHQDFNGEKSCTNVDQNVVSS